MANFPIGDVCVLRATDSDHWTVAICWGGVRECLGHFADKKEAGDFAVAVRNRRLRDGQPGVIHFPDDCPCVPDDADPPAELNSISS